jgi:GH15 family glucan-1,4-alpha-glucosidase
MTSPTRSPFPRISDYGFISDCHSGALISPDGAIEWLCLPRFDSPSIFAAVLDRRAGSFRLGPANSYVPVARAFEPGTNMLTTWWMTHSGWLMVRDAMLIGDWREGGESADHVRPPSDHDTRQVLVRIARCFQGHVDLEMFCDPAFDYGAKRPEWTMVDDERHAADATDGETTVRLTSDLGLGIGADRIRAHHTLGNGEACFCALSSNKDLEGPRTLEEAQAAMASTGDFWRRWLAGGNFPEHPWRNHLQRSALTLKGLTYTPTGATVAALTTSLPETPGGERNWDYRYTWIRDASFTLWGLHTLGFDWEAEDFVEFVADVCRREGSELQIMYGIGGEKELPERLWELVEDQVEAAVSAWKEPDQGIWETRGPPKHYVSSKLMCWVALDRGARLAEHRDAAELAERWRKIAEEIRDDVLEHGVSERGVFRQHYETDALDASVLLAPLLRFLPADDERIRATVLAIADELTDHGLVLRYKVDETEDGLSGVEGTFTICSFWLVSALSEIGEAERARHLCERLLSMAGPLGLYAEEIEPRSGSHLGNFPQAFTHLALINAVSHVIADELAEEGGGRPGPSAVFSEMRR